MGNLCCCDGLKGSNESKFQHLSEDMTEYSLSDNADPGFLEKSPLNVPVKNPEVSMADLRDMRDYNRDIRDMPGQDSDSDVSSPYTRSSSPARQGDRRDDIHPHGGSASARGSRRTSPERNTLRPYERTQILNHDVSDHDSQSSEGAESDHRRYSGSDSDRSDTPRNHRNHDRRKMRTEAHSRSPTGSSRRSPSPLSGMSRDDSGGDIRAGSATGRRQVTPTPDTECYVEDTTSAESRPRARDENTILGGGGRGGNIGRKKELSSPVGTPMLQARGDSRSPRRGFGREEVLLGDQGGRFGDDKKNPMPKRKQKTSMREASSYYHFPSTPTDQAKKYQPKLVVDPESRQQDLTNRGRWAGGSGWNTGATYESRDYSNWARERFRELVHGLEFDGFDIEVTEIVDTNISAQIHYTRGRRRLIYDISFKLKWSGEVNGRTVSGRVEMQDIMPDEEESEWYFTVTSDKSDPFHDRSRGVVSTGRDLLVDCINTLIKELSEKK